MDAAWFFIGGFFTLFTVLTKDFDLSLALSGVLSFIIAVFLLKDWTSIMGIAGIALAAIGGILHLRGH